MMVRGDRATNGVVLLIAVVLLSVLYTVDAQVTYRKAHIRMQRLCSRRLADALYIVCRERGYNEPFSYSSEDDREGRADPGPGLVEECCYHSCTYEQLEQYCKPLPVEKQVDSRDDVIDESSITNLSYSTARGVLEQHPRSEGDYAGDAIKRKVDDLKKRERHKGKGDRNVDGECKGKADGKKRHRGRHCRCRRRRLECRQAGKISRGNAKPLDNKFISSSTIDKPTTFPSVS